jgi:hypothetical protein
MGGVLEADEREKFLGPITEHFSGHAAEFAVKMECLFAGEEFIKIGILRQQPHGFAALHVAAVATEDGRAARSGCDEAEDDLHRSALTGAVGTKQAIDRAGLDGEAEIFHGDHFSTAKKGGIGEFLAEIFDGDGGSHRCSGVQ